jgi:hypothetical protein
VANITTVKETVSLSSNITQGCPYCDTGIHHERLNEGINHFLEAHGFTLLHVGSEWGRDSDGTSIHHTVAVLGTDNPPARKPPVKVVVMGKEITMG